MALRMSQMLRFSRELRRIQPKGTGAAAAGKTIREQQPPPQVSAPPAHPEIDPLIVEVASAAPDAEQAQDPAEQAYGQLVSAGQEVFSAAGNREAPNGPAIVAAVRAGYCQVLDGNELLSITVRRKELAEDWAHRSANVSVLAMRLGLELEYDERRALALGLCGLMHDVGMLTIPEGVLGGGRFTDEQLDLLHRHPGESQRMIGSFGKGFQWVGRIVVQIHERQDGSGYPSSASGEDIHEFARIIGLVDTYEAMAQPRSDRKAKVVYNALKEIIDQRNSLFDRRLIKALINVVSIFPLGSLVKLNNGEIGRVVATSRLHPTRPSVDILVDARSHKLAEPRHLNLEDEPMLYIVDPAIEEDVLA